MSQQKKIINKYVQEGYDFGECERCIVFKSRLKGAFNIASEASYATKTYKHIEWKFFFKKCLKNRSLNMVVAESALDSKDFVEHKCQFQSSSGQTPPVLGIASAS